MVAAFRAKVSFRTLFQILVQKLEYVGTSTGIDTPLLQQRCHIGDDRRTSARCHSGRLCPRSGDVKTGSLGDLNYNAFSPLSRNHIFGPDR